MDKKEDWKLIEGSRYKILSIGGRDSTLETEGIFKGYATIGIEEAGLVIELCTEHEKRYRQTPHCSFHAILAIDVLDVKKHEGKDEEKEPESLLRIITRYNKSNKTKNKTFIKKKLLLFFYVEINHFSRVR